MTYSLKRQYVSNLYRGTGWKKSVEKMPDDQITTIYLKHIREGKMPDEDVEIENEQGHLDIPPRPPHANEDDFPIY